MNDENTLIEHSFYLSSMFSTMKPEHSWSTNEIKYQMSTNFSGYDN